MTASLASDEGGSSDKKPEEAEAEPIFCLQGGGVTPGPDLVTATTHPQRVKKGRLTLAEHGNRLQRPVVKRGLKKKG